MGRSVSSHAKLFVDISAFGPTAYLASLCTARHKFQAEEKPAFFLARYYLMFCLHFSKMSVQEMASETYIRKKHKKQ